MIHHDPITSLIESSIVSCNNGTFWQRNIFSRPQIKNNFTLGLRSASRSRGKDSYIGFIFINKFAPIWTLFL
nr:MAG TPA: hypothetical protein [Caudoviricetes sp.]